MAIVSLTLGALAFISAGLFTSSLVASLAEPVALILSAASGIMFLAEVVRQGYLTDFVSSSEGEFILAGILAAVIALIVFAATQALVVSLSPLAGMIVVGLGVAVFIFGPGVLFDLFEVLNSFRR